MSGSAQVTHALTIDVESFAEALADSVAVAPEFLDPAAIDSEIEQNLDVTLALLAETDCRATFFFLGRIAGSAPALVRRVAEAGHEIGCHSLYHRRITMQTPEEFRQDITEARQRLQDISGQAVAGFRAPDFSIMADNQWALDELLAAGFRYDSSVVPMRLHDVYGMGDVPREVFRWPNGLIEFPLPVVRFLGVALPMGGGGYFRLNPVMLTSFFYRRWGRQGHPQAFYIHPYEIGPSAPRIGGLSAARRFRHYVRLGKGQERLRRLLQALEFETMAAVLNRSGHLPEGR
jgi:polysaccharide deacetylase family protein (PEP-CTERM system associated)